MGASIGTLGTARAQYHLRQCFITLDMYPINKPEIMVNFAHEKIGENGELKDEKTKALIAKLLENLVNWTRKLKKK